MIPILSKIIRWYRHLTMYVIADATDNSITLSRHLFNHIGVMRLEVAKVFVFRLTGSGDYAFCLNPPFADSTQVSDIMYNTKYRCVGFESLCPTVNRIFYDYGLPSDSRCRLSVEPGITANGIKYYHIMPPRHRHG